MRRYLFSADTDFNTALNFDCIIVGGGMAGLYAALNLDNHLKVALFTKDSFEDASCSSRLAQGGIAAVMNSTDTVEAHINDTLIAGAGHCKREAVEVLCKEGPNDIRHLISLCVPFDRTGDGELRITREGGHSQRRIVHCGGDATGHLVTKTLTERVMELDNVEIFKNSYLVDILTLENRAVGIVVMKNNRFFAAYSSNIIICTGGVGQLYRYSTNPPGTKGEGLAACMRAGAVAKDMEFVQFHPTSLLPSKNAERMFLISEAVRGEGGILKNKKGEAFMKNAHPLRDLAPRDIVTRAILSEMKRQGSDDIFLDVASMSEDFFENRFPTIFAECRKYGVRVPFEPIPVCPTQHYLMGGIETDLNAKTNIEGLFVCGEAACTGVQGANRLASNSTLECLVFGRRAANSVNFTSHEIINNFSVKAFEDIIEITSDLAAEELLKLRVQMTEKVGALRKRSELREMFTTIEYLKERYFKTACDIPDKLTLLNAITVCGEITEKALMRKESVGSHFIIAE